MQNVTMHHNNVYIVLPFYCSMPNKVFHIIQVILACKLTREEWLCMGSTILLCHFPTHQALHFLKEYLLCQAWTVACMRRLYASRNCATHSNCEQWCNFFSVAPFIVVWKIQNLFVMIPNAFSTTRLVCDNL